MYAVYIIQNEQSKSIYIGYTNNLKRCGGVMLMIDDTTIREDDDEDEEDKEDKDDSDEEESV